MSLYNFLQKVSRYIDEQNAKDGVELVLKPNHHFRCTSCGSTHTLRFDAVKCCKPVDQNTN